ncbi:hypothetical protein [Streptomyces sp. 1331.2]|uniref:hypothetical protein n=1 Tax=Streptomyces sp. 1331.2 TaxID=1938835 RepID=UPI000BDACB7B|nr:hypothetical protein [Streptomyces sp. 1331.2]SOB89033.1 hypothetical protein SAMN06272789_7363 [Streptomyces sp. 1331.2]
MSQEQPLWRLEVLAGGDTLRQERLTRDLQDALRRAGTPETAYLTAETTPADDGRKGGALSEITALGLAAAAARPASRILIELIKEWCAKDRHRKVEITDGERSLTVTGRPDEAQERIIQAFLDQADESDTPEGEQA